MARSLSNAGRPSNASNMSLTSLSQRRPTRIMLTEKKVSDDEFMAAAIGDVEWLKHTFKGKKGALMNFDKNGLAAIHISAIHGRLDCLKWLIEHFKVDVNCRSSDGWTPLHLCISNQTGRRSFDCLLYLLQHGANPSVTNDDGITPMHQACSEGHVQCLKALLEAGAKIDGSNCRGHKPIDMAKLWGHRTCARIMAAEQWHQDKKYLMNELQHLKKLSMQQVMLDIEADTPKPRTVGMDFGDVADKPASKLSGKGRSSKGKILPPSVGDSLFKSNSARHPKGGVQLRKEMTAPLSSEKSTLSTGSKLGDIQEMNERNDSSPCVHDDVDIPECLSVHMEGYSFSICNPNPWNKSTKVPDKSYVNNLKDHYPRDEYTMLPKFPPKRPSQQHEEPRTIDIPRDSHTHKPNWLKKPASQVDRVLVMLTPPSTAPVYKPKHIGDVHKLKHYDPDILPKPEVALHLCSDVRSRLFNMSLATPAVPPSSGPICWSESNSSQNNNNDVDLLEALKRIQKPAGFLSGDPHGLAV